MAGDDDDRDLFDDEHPGPQDIWNPRWPTLR